MAAGLLKAGAMFGTIVLVMVSALRWQVRRKQRTSFNDTYYIEDSIVGNGTRYKVVMGANDTAGEYFTVELLIRAQAYGAVKGKPGCQHHHLHLKQDEHIKVLKGTLGYYTGHHSHAAKAGPGEEVVINPGEAHTLWNVGGGKNGGDLLIHVTHTPARYGESFYETLAGLGHDYDSPLAVSPLQRAITYHRAEAVLTDISPAMWEAHRDYFIPFGEAVGYRAFYPQYTTKRDPARSGSSGLSGEGAEAESPAQSKGAGGYLEDYEDV